MKDMNILILTTIPAPYRVELFNELGKYYNLTVCFEQYHDDTRNENWYVINNYNFKAVFLKDTKKKISIKFDFNRYFKDENYSCILFFEYSTLTASYFILKSIIERKLFILNCDGSLLDNESLHKKIIKSIFVKNANGYITGGIYGKYYFEKYGANTNLIHTINFTSLYQEDIINTQISKIDKIKLREKYNITGEKVAIAVGRFIHSKNFERLIKIWANIDKNHTLLLIGEGKYEEKYLNMIKKLNINNIRVLPFLKKEKLLDYYKLSDILIHPTLSDVWGLVINEAMACGLPVITTDKCVAGMELIESGKNGYVVDAYNDEEMYNRIQLLFNDDQLREIIGDNNISKISHYTYEVSSKKLSNAIHTLCIKR